MEDVRTGNIVRLYKEKLNVLLDVAQTINENHSVEDLMQEFETLMREELGVSKILVYTLDEGRWNTILSCGVMREQENNIDVETDLIHIKKITSLGFEENSHLDGFDAVLPLYHNYKLTGYVLVGDNGTEDGISPTIRNLKFIQILSNLIIVFIQNKKMQQKLIHQETIKKELEIAQGVQQNLVPSNQEIIPSSYVNIKSLYYPHLEVGGDYYDVIRLSRHSIGFCIADVSGKGIGAAILMSNFQAMVRALFNSHVSLKKLTAELNKRVSQNTTYDKFITLFIGRYNTITGKLSYINAGHLPPIVWNEKKKEMIELERGCIGLGMLDTIPGLEVGTVKISKGSKLIAFTDGLVEIDEGNRVQSSFDQLKKILRETSSIDETMEQIKNMVTQNKDEGLIFDDVSVLGIEFIKKSFL
jgi:sigma-B regulation protein RsbU (phosphoserine phosphatase)